MPHTNQMFEPIAATRSLLKRDRKKKNLIPEIQNLSENEPLKELHQNEIKLPNIPVVRKLRGVGRQNGATKNVALCCKTNYQNFFELPLPPAIGTCKSEQECFTKCSKAHDCIKYAFNITHGNCHLINSFDPINGIKVPTVVSRTIISSSNHYKTPLGIQRSSNLISYVLTKLKPFLRIQVENNDFTVSLNWTIIEPVKLRTYLIHSSINESSYFDQYFESNLHDFDDPNQSMHHLNLNDCFYKCALNSSCLAFTWNRFENKCFLKSNKNRTRICDPNYFCSSIMADIFNLVLPNIFEICRSSSDLCPSH
ncbi:hypothetical protein BpHYR1_025945 [Brachionus plicatilis]|uniref:Apple domain-containing protein n=1 Tax=Brachionus plicatilis TaxID=10195 RepID=A0A3M7SMW6_BRAPC|nr:hypothetical protein BpHYR1_025945 [Brachionus plicatilis]